MKKFISILLALTLLFSTLSVLAFADTETLYRDGDVEFYVLDNEAYIVKVLDTDEGNVVIPSLVSMEASNKITSIAARDISGDDNETDDPYGYLIHVVAILDGAFNDIESQVKSVAIPAYVTEIGESALRLVNLETILVSDKNTTYSSYNGSLYNKDQDVFILHPQASADQTIADTVTTIMPGAFEKSLNITSVTIPSGVTVIPDNCFNDCIELRSVNFSSANIQKIGEFAFSSTALTSVEFNSSISEIAPFAFYGSENISEVIIPETAANVKVGSAAFFGCPITEITLYRNVTEIGDHAFGYYYDDLTLAKYPLVITGYKYTPDKTDTTNTYAYAIAEDPGYTLEPFEFHPLDPIYSVKVTATDASINTYNAKMFLYKNKNLKYTAESNNGVFTFENVDTDDYSIYVLTEFGVLVNLGIKASVQTTYIEEHSYTTDKYSPTGDLNRDGIIDMSDVSMLLAADNYGSETNLACDINHDGVVDVNDIAVILNSANYAAQADNIVKSSSTPIVPI